MNIAHREKLIVYDSSRFNEEAPCQALWKVTERVKTTTQARIAELVHDDIRDGYYKKIQRIKGKK